MVSSKDRGHITGEEVMAATKAPSTNEWFPERNESKEGDETPQHSKRKRPDKKQQMSVTTDAGKDTAPKPVEGKEAAAVNEEDDLSDFSIDLDLPVDGVDANEYDIDPNV